VSHEWFRSPDWDSQAEADFEAKLRRSRAYKRPQYLRIKAIALLDAGRKDVARQLLQRVIAEYPEALDFGSALELIGDIERAQGAQDAAEAHYRRLLLERPSLNATSGMVEVSLAEVLIERGRVEDREEALRLLDSCLKHRRPVFNSQLFRWHVTLARLAHDMGDLSTQRTAATSALRLADPGPQLPRHPTVGRVNADADLIRWLRSLQ